MRENRLYFCGLQAAFDLVKTCENMELFRESFLDFADFQRTILPELQKMLAQYSGRMDYIERSIISAVTLFKQEKIWLVASRINHTIRVSIHGKPCIDFLATHRKIRRLEISSQEMHFADCAESIPRALWRSLVPVQYAVFDVKENSITLMYRIPVSIKELRFFVSDLAGRFFLARDGVVV